MSKCASRNLAPAQGQLAEMVELHAKAEETVDALSEAGKSIAVWGLWKLASLDCRLSLPPVDEQFACMFGME